MRCRTRIQGTAAVGVRECQYSAVVDLSMYDNCDPHPAYREQGKITLEEVDELSFKVTIWSDEFDSILGEYEDEDAPEAERKYWDQRVEVEIKRKLARTHAGEFEWIEDEE